MTRCKCCGRVLEKDTFLANKQFCNRCSNYISPLKNQISNLKHRVRTLTIKIYGVKDGRERLRLNETN